VPVGPARFAFFKPDQKSNCIGADGGVCRGPGGEPPSRKRRNQTENTFLVERILNNPLGPKPQKVWHHRKQVTRDRIMAAHFPSRTKIVSKAWRYGLAAISCGLALAVAMRPDHWNIRALVMTAVPLAGLLVLFSLTVLLVCWRVLGLSIGQIRTLAFLTLVFGGQGTVYLVRERGHLSRSRPSRWMLLSSLADIVAVGILAVAGVLMVPLSWTIVGALLVAVVVYLCAVDFLKVWVFRASGVQCPPHGGIDRNPAWNLLTGRLQRHQRFLNRRMIARLHIFLSKLMEFAEDPVGFC